ncbi:MAG: bifunctional 5,10-methylenetetrahydrofolate dehydrogenase/5,10-methenyltetrahydrofolate cyclohydrolase [Candidatus Thermoplasmatota archaeon]|jgi:methylenetetrahydrofolate dehydrogenase (NADP+)/methenyltetrahydrofolate cyclohydrolase|nr:bifunctional 5,10-methylenetetrahydrofolate dehydrogenase/5,10-methenyltetrahydrofolate cyclohydrolase [Candidatus Thermoplasmatota archaeon]
MTLKIIDGKKIAGIIKKEASKELENLYNQYKIKPNITTIKIGNDSSSDLYLRLRDNACKEIGITSNHLEFPDDVTEKEIINSINKLNSDNKVHGILIQFPIPNHISANKLFKSIQPNKDVEGFNPHNLGKTLIGDESIIPCTPLAVLKILEYEKEKIEGKDIVIINHSNIVGKPLAILLLNRNATTSICHVFTKNLKNYTSKADILITATGIPNMLTKDFVKKGSFIIDVGISKTKNGITGDVDFKSVKDKINSITPVPGGVGPITVACAIKNMLKTYRYCLESNNF